MKPSVSESTVKMRHHIIQSDFKWISKHLLLTVRDLLDQLQQIIELFKREEALEADAKRLRLEYRKEIKSMDRSKQSRVAYLVILN